MKFKKIRFKNFLSYGNKWTEFKLNSNELILITGGNGRGKSSVLESIYFAYTGRSYRNVPKPKLVNNKNQKNMLVEMEMEHQNKKYLIRRGVKPAIFEIFRDGELIDEDSNIRDYQKQLETMMGIDHKTFKQTIMMSSRHYTPFLELRPAEKREFIEQIFSLKLFTDMNDFLKRKIQNTKQNIKGLDKDIDHTLYNLTVLKNINAKQLSNNQFQKKGLLDAIEKLKQENDEFDGEITGKQDKINEIDSKLEDYKKKISYKQAVQKKLDLLEYKIKKHLERIQFFEENDTCKTCEQTITQESKETSIATEINKLEVKNEEHKKFNTSLLKIQEIETQTNQIIRAINEFRQEIMVLRSKQDGNEFNINEKKELINNIDSTSVVSTDEFTKLNEDLQKLRKNHKHLEQFLKYAKMTIEMISEKGIKKYIISKYIPILNTLLNKYLKCFEAPYSVMFNEELEENIIARGYEDLGYGNLSAGEKQRLDSSLVFSFLELCRLKNSVNTNLMIMDEILDQSLDGAGIDGILKVFAIMKSQGYTILVVSHKENFADSFDKVYEATKKKFSVLEEIS